MKPVLENLEVLHLGYNGIRDMALLQLGRLPSLRALFLQGATSGFSRASIYNRRRLRRSHLLVPGNEISKIEGMEGLNNLRELVLDRNRIKSFDEYSFASQWNLQELHVEENRIKELTNVGSLGSLQRLFLGMNRVQVGSS